MPNRDRDYSHMRKAYTKDELTDDQVIKHPYHLFQNWFQDLLAYQDELEPNAMTLATVDSFGQPSARTVLMKAMSSDGFCFYTNYKSTKGRQLAYNPKAALLFWWPPLERQVRMEGTVTKLDARVSNKYFSKRPLESQVGATISPQSQVIADRSWLNERFNAYLAQAQQHKTDLPRPPFWGGYLFKPHMYEFWQGRKGRLHDRIQYILAPDGRWIANRLAP